MYAMWLMNWLYACGTNFYIRGWSMIPSTQQWFLLWTRFPLLNLGSPLINPGQSLVPTSEPVTHHFQYTETKWCMTYKVMQQQQQQQHLWLHFYHNQHGIYHFTLVPTFELPTSTQTIIITFRVQNYNHKFTTHMYNHIDITHHISYI